MSRALNHATLPCQLVDPVLSLSNSLQKAMHVRVYHHFGSSSSRCQDVKSTQSCNTAKPAGYLHQGSSSMQAQISCFVIGLQVIVAMLFFVCACVSRGASYCYCFKPLDCRCVLGVSTKLASYGLCLPHTIEFLMNFLLVLDNCLDSKKSTKLCSHTKQ